tara:strand:+ start:614 stop:937 length:324 start_codon:yes stop_codon:yes gene_type:complete
MAFVLGGLALFVSLAALWLSADSQRKVSSKNNEMLQGYIKPLKEALEADRKENENLRKQVQTDRDMIETLSEKVKFLEDIVKAAKPAPKTAAATSPTEKNQANGTNG